MASTSETSHAKNVTNFETQIAFCTAYGSAYNPSNEILTLASLNQKHLKSDQAVKQVKTTETPFKEIEGQRQTLFKLLKPLSTKVFNALISSGAPSTVIADAETINRKIQGKSANTAQKTAKEGETPTDSISTSQQSYDMQLDNFEKLIELVQLETKYNPNEEPLKTAILITYKDQLKAINTSYKTIYTPYSNAMIARDKELYDPETGLVAIALLVKNYVKSIFGASSPEYKQISGIQFKNRK